MLQATATLDAAQSKDTLLRVQLYGHFLICLIASSLTGAGPCMVAHLIGTGAQEVKQQCNAICFHMPASRCLGVLHQGWQQCALQEGCPAHQLLKQLPKVHASEDAQC